MGTPESAKSPTLVTNAAGASATPEKYSPKNQRTSKTPGTENSTSVASSKTPGAVARASLNGMRATKASMLATTTQTSNHRTVKRPLPTIPSNPSSRLPDVVACGHKPQNLPFFDRTRSLGQPGGPEQPR